MGVRQQGCLLSVHQMFPLHSAQPVVIEVQNHSGRDRFRCRWPQADRGQTLVRFRSYLATTFRTVARRKERNRGGEGGGGQRRVGVKGDVRGGGERQDERREEDEEEERGEEEE